MIDWKGLKENKYTQCLLTTEGAKTAIVPCTTYHWRDDLFRHVAGPLRSAGIPGLEINLTRYCISFRGNRIDFVITDPDKLRGREWDYKFDETGPYIRRHYYPTETTEKTKAPQTLFWL